MEVIEHVADPRSFIGSLAARLAPGGLMILSTPNRTGWSKLLTITLAEGFGQIPKGTHDYDKFIDPETMRALLAQAGLECIDFEGIAMSPTRGLRSAATYASTTWFPRSAPNKGTAQRGKRASGFWQH